MLDRSVRTLLAAAALAVLAGCAMDETQGKQPAAEASEAASPMRWPDLLERARPAPDTAIAYGSDPLQVIDLWLPPGPGPHPVALMVHGGCWQTDIADRSIMAWIADDLRRRGIAVWNIEYRGVDRAGGGYPGTFLDAAAAADALPAHAARYRLDPRRLVAVGHSAGGHLALWLAARHRLPRTSPLHRANPLRIPTVVSLGGLPDLEEAARPPGSGCGTEIVARLTGSATAARRDVFADTSVPSLAPIGARQILINGTEDRIIPTSHAESYAAPMRAAGDKVDVRLIERSGHVELIAPETEAWGAAARDIEAALRK